MEIGIGKKISAWRKERGFTQAQLAEKSNPSHSAKMKNPAAATVTGFFLYFQWFAGFYIAFVHNKII